MNLGEVINVNGELYQVHRKVRDTGKIDAEVLREFWYCTHTFKKDEVFYFVREIKSVNYEDIHE